MNALNVGNPLRESLLSLNTVDFTLEKTLINAVSVGNLLHLGGVSVIIHKFTLDQGSMSAVKSFQKISKKFHSPLTSLFTDVERSLCVVNVGKPLPLVPPFVLNREFTRKVLFMTGVWEVFS